MRARFRALRNLPGNMDPIADMMVALKNAGNAGLESVSLPYSRIKEDIAKVLKTEGFVRGVETKLEKGKKRLIVTLVLENRTSKIRGAKRLSKTSKRVYKKASEIRAVKNGYGLLVMTTPKGVMSGKDAKKAGVGGEVLFSIW
ncbi:MAG: 30S ribosomal protein S8 [Parcubacteria group bacterium]